MQTKLYHLSHIDLDGYGCQYLSSQAFTNINCYNSNYGPEVTARLKEIIDDINNDNSKPDAIILITDLNLTQKEANWIQKEAINLGVGLQLLDHHITGEKTATNHTWYHLDIAHCGTWLTYEWLQNKYGFDEHNKLRELVDTINSVDMWHSDSELFEYGKVMMSMISGAREINRTMFASNDMNYKLTLIDNAKDISACADAHIVLDDSIHKLKKEFFKIEKNDTKDNLVASYMVNMMTLERNRFTITYNGYKGVLGYLVGNASIIGNAFLVANPDYNFYMDINFRGGFSLRGNDTLDVSQMALVIGNGGGHRNASGGKVDGYVDSFVYEEIRAFVQKYIDEKSKLI